MNTVSREVLEKAHKAGLRLKMEYAPYYTVSENNRAMELAFLWGLLGYPFDEERAREGQ